MLADTEREGICGELGISGAKRSDGTHIGTMSILVANGNAIGIDELLSEVTNGRVYLVTRRVDGRLVGLTLRVGDSVWRDD